MPDVSSFFSVDSLTVLAAANALVLAVTQGVRVLLRTGPRVTLFCCFITSAAVVLATTSWDHKLIVDLLIALGNTFLLFLSVIGSAQFLAGSEPQTGQSNNGRYRSLIKLRNKLVQPLL